jgi:hypothetical protein
MKKLLIVLLSTLMIIFSLGFSNYGDASNTSDSLNTTIKKLPNKLELSWQTVNKATEYVLYHDEKIIYKGSKTKFQHGNLSDGEYMVYHLFALDKNGIILDHNNIDTSVIHPKYKSKLGLDIIKSANKVFIDWYDIENSSNMRYSLNGENFINIDKSQLTINNLIPSTNYELIIQADNLLDKSKESGELEESVKPEENGDHFIKIPLQTSEKVKGESLNDIVNNKEQKFSIATIEEISSFKHKTFISPNPFKFEPYGMALQCGKGDGRTFSETSTQFRTQLLVNVYWNTRDVSNTVTVNNSTMYDKNCDTSKAVTKPGINEGIGAYTNFITTTEANLYVSHEAKTAFFGGLLPSINYAYTLVLYRNGTTYIQGSHDAFPWHEIYKKDSISSSWYRIYDFSPSNGGNDVWKLAAIWPNVSINKTIQ